MDTVKSKIDDWDLHTGDLDLSSFNRTALKRTFSDFGPRSSSLKNHLATGGIIKDHHPPLDRGRLTPYLTRIYHDSAGIPENGTITVAEEDKHSGTGEKLPKISFYWGSDAAPGGAVWI
jgi:hypothetical protein